MWKRGGNAPKEQFLLFSTIFSICLTTGVKLHIHLLNMVVRFIVFFTSATLIFRGTDISKCFRKSLGIRDNQSRLYLLTFAPKEASNQPAYPHTDQSQKLCFLGYLKCAKWWFWLEFTNTQSGWNLLWRIFSKVHFYIASGSFMCPFVRSSVRYAFWCIA